MKMLFINRVLGFWRGGGETFDLKIAAEMTRLGHNICFLTSCKSDGSVPMPVLDYETEYVYTPYLDSIVTKANKKYRGLGKLWLLDKLIWANRVLTILHRNNSSYDGVMINGIPYLGNKIVSTMNMPSIVMFHGLPDPLWYRSIRESKYIPASVGDAFRHVRKLNARTIELPLGIPDEKVQRNEKHRLQLRSSLGISEDDKVILFVGRLEPVKNLPMLLNAFERTRNSCVACKLLIVGDGAEYPRLAEMASVMGGSVIFAGRVAHDEIGQYYQIADIFAMTSIYDNFPNVILEAMYYGLPIVATTVGGIPLQVSHGMNGYLTPARDEIAFANSLQMLLLSEETRKSFGMRNQQQVRERFSWSKTSNTILQAFANIDSR